MCRCGTVVVVPSSSCPGCGLPDGRQACQDLFNDIALRVRALAWTGSLTTWRLMHDVYAVQHEEEFCGSYKLLAMHLGGLCWAVEHGGAESGYRALLKWTEQLPKSLEGRDYPPAPGIPAERGKVTIASLGDLNQPDLLTNGVDRWARSVWLAYTDLQPIAREWIRDAIGPKK